ncbi:MAG: MotA/TolQ/ExbB proton channel family protein, partial [Limisphaerales bacterium]
MDFASPMFASALDFAFKQATPEGKLTICALLVVSIFSWTVIISKARQLIRARKAGKKFFAAYRSTRDPLDLYRKAEEFDGAPAYELYHTGAEETEYHLKNNPVRVDGAQAVTSGIPTQAQTDVVARSITTKMSHASFDTVRVALERAASYEAMSLEKGMIVLSTAVAGGPFLGLLG